jgi:hypothetical protein
MIKRRDEKRHGFAKGRIIPMPKTGKRLSEAPKAEVLLLLRFRNEIAPPPSKKLKGR